MYLECYTYNSKILIRSPIFINSKILMWTKLSHAVELKESVIDSAKITKLLNTFYTHTRYTVGLIDIIMSYCDNYIP